MPGIYYYLSLAVIGIGIAVFTITKKKNVALFLSFYLFAMMVADSGEVLVMALFQSYSYKLGISSDYMVNNILGHVIPNSTLWPATALLVVAFSLKYRWILLISIIYMLLDILFVRLGIYQHNWWKTYYTGIAIFAYCAMMKGWYSKLNDERYKILRYIMFSSMQCAIILSISVLFLLAGKELFHIGLFDNKYRDSIVFAYAFDAAISFTSVFFICVLRKWYWRLVPFILLPACSIAFYKTGILYFSQGWNIYYKVLTNAICLLLFIALERKYSYRHTDPIE